MALSNLDATLLFNDLDALSPRSNTTNDSLADQVAESALLGSTKLTVAPVVKL